MSQKTTRRARRHTTEDSETKSSTPKPNDSETKSSTPKSSDSETKSSTPKSSDTDKVEESPSSQEETVTNAPPQEKQEEEAKIQQNGTEKVENEVSKEVDNCIMTRSRSATPQVKKQATKQNEEEQEKPSSTETIAEESEKNEEREEEHDLDTSGKEEMDPLIVSDEPDPELVFEENSDVESGKSSPILTRCKTRRSQTRNIPTPKTPRAEERDDLNSTFESCSDDFSTKAEAGGDSTRLDYMDKDFSNLENNSFLQGTKDKSFGEAMRLLSTRRTIRPMGEDYRKRLLKSNLDKTDFGSKTDFGTRYQNRKSVERVSSVGLKRKNSEEDEGITKRFKSDSPGFFSRLTSPFNSIRNSFRSEIPSSTPKLTGYKDEKFLLEDGGSNSQMCEVGDGERRWCSIM